TCDVLAIEPERLEKRGRIAVLLGASRLWVPRRQGGRGSRGAEPSLGGSVAGPPRCERSNDKRISDVARSGTDGSRRASGRGAARNLHEIRARPCGQSTPSGRGCFQS